VTITEGSVTDVVVATSAQDAAAVQAVRQHHAELAGALAVRVEALLATADAGGEPFEDARRGRWTSWPVSWHRTPGPRK